VLYPPKPRSCHFPERKFWRGMRVWDSLILIASNITCNLLYNKEEKVNKIIMDAKTVLFIALSFYSYYFMDRTLKNTPKDGPLTKKEKIQVIILLILNTIFSWAIFSFGWKNKLPTKSKQVNKYFKNIFISLIGIAIVAVILSALLIATNPASQIKKANQINKLQK